jgi:aspartate-semialdehyde dehydrogenase
VYKIAIAGASTLLGRELKEALSESPLAAPSFVLLDEDEAQGQLDQVGDEVTFVQAIGAMPLSAWTSHSSAARKT